MGVGKLQSVVCGFVFVQQLLAHVSSAEQHIQDKSSRMHPKYDPENLKYVATHLLRISGCGAVRVAYASVWETSIGCLWVCICTAPFVAHVSSAEQQIQGK